MNRRKKVNLLKKVYEDSFKASFIIILPILVFATVSIIIGIMALTEYPISSAIYFGSFLVGTTYIAVSIMVLYSTKRYFRNCIEYWIKLNMFRKNHDRYSIDKIDEFIRLENKYNKYFYAKI